MLQPYIDEAKANSAKYRLKLAEWERRMIIEGHENLVRRSTLKRPTRPRKAAGHKKSPRKAVPRKQGAKAKVKTVGTQTETRAKVTGTVATQKSGTQATKGSSAGKKSPANKSEE